jgi:hypothetical protein
MFNIIASRKAEEKELYQGTFRSRGLKKLRDILPNKRLLGMLPG